MPDRGHLIDVVDCEGGDDPALRPNQLLAIAPRHAILDPAHWKSVVDTVKDRLLTPVGLRTLDRAHPDYKPNYHGDLLSLFPLVDAEELVQSESRFTTRVA
jgi:predicted glycogen debranching enzyme